LIFGFEPAEEPEAASHVLTARQAFEEVLLEALRVVGPTYVSFSGGRDSSAVLAVAVDMARSNGLGMPIPITNRYPGVGAASENEWQEKVVRHLGLSEWVKVASGPDDDILGESARRSLLRFGPLWPPTLHLKGRLLQIARGGTVVTGEGGDAILGPRRISPLAGLLHRRVYPRRRAIRRAAESVAPLLLRRRFVQRDIRTDARRPWLTPRTRDALSKMLVSDALSEPLNWSRSVQNLPQARSVAIGLRNLKSLADIHGVMYVHPFHDVRFVRAWAAQGGVLGFPGRTAAMQALFGDLLPAEILSRDTKATFGAAYVGGPAREFMRGWAGDGVDTKMVISERLRDELLQPEPHAGTLPLLHSIWLRTRDKGVGADHVEG
jgi:asparagine synthase (glutamine-hydrolysing)